MNQFETFRDDPFFSNAKLEHLPFYDDHDHPFDFMRNRMHQMRMNDHEFNDDNNQGIAYSSSTVMSMDSRNGGKPRIIQTTSEILRGPNGFERTRKGHRDTERNIEKMEVAHRLGERGYKILKERDPSTGKILENQEFHDIQDEQEWFDHAEKYGLKNTNENSFDTLTNNLLMAPSQQP